MTNTRKREKANLPMDRRYPSYVKYDPWYEVDRMFDEMRSHFFSDLLSPTYDLSNVAGLQRMPAADVIDLGDKYEVTVEMPGVSKENVDVEVTTKDVKVSANYTSEGEEKEHNWVCRERSEMNFYRMLSFPEEVKTDSADAHMDQGILKILIAKQHPGPQNSGKKVNIK